MNIAWVYLDKKAAAIRAVKDYRSMDRIVSNYVTELEETRTRMIRAYSPLVSLAPRSTDTVSPEEERIAGLIDVMDVIEERYRCATEYMGWFLPAWNALDESERFILSEFYQTGGVSRDVTVSTISCTLFLERAQIYRYKDKALERLALLLYGR